MLLSETTEDGPTDGQCNLHLCSPAVSQWGLCNAFSLCFWGFNENPKSASVPGMWNQSGLYVRVEEESENIF